MLGWRKKAGARVTYARREYTVEVRINSHGLRDAERDYAAAAGRLRVLALGDSFLEAYTVPEDRMVTRALETVLARDGCRAEVVNGGTAGYSTDQEYLFYTSEGQRYAPRVVVLFFFYNDILYTDRQDYFGQPKPIFQMTPEGLRLHRFPVRELPPEQPREAAAEAEAGQPSGSALLALLGDRLWHGAPGAYDALARLGLWRPITPVKPRAELLVYDRRSWPAVENAWDKVAAVLGALRRDTAAAGSSLAVAYIPSRMEVQERSWALTRALYGLREGDWDRQGVLRRLQEIGAQQGFPVLDLTPGLQAAESPFRSAYFTYDGHWNEEGHRLAAEAVGGLLREKGWLGPCLRPAPSAPARPRAE